MKTKNKFLPALCVVASFLFASCVDVVQVVGFENGQYKYNLRLTVSKALLAMGGGNVSDFENEFGGNEFPPEVTMNIINNDYDYGMDFAFSADPKTATDELKSILPKKLKSGKIEIPLVGCDEYANSMNNAANPESEAFAKALLSSAKWRVYVSKKIVPHVGNAAIKTNDSNKEVPFYEVGDVYCIEIPMPEIKQNTRIIIEN